MQDGTATGSRPNRRQFLRAVRAAGVAAFAGGAATACAPGPRTADAAAGRDDVIRIGYVSPETGPLAPYGEADRFVVDVMAEFFAANPVHVGGRPHRVEILRRDSQSDSNRAGDVAAGLVLDDGIHLMLVSATSDTANAVSDQCEAAGLPCVATATPWQSWFYGRGGRPQAPFAWTYLFSWGLEDTQAVYADMWDQVATNRTAGALWPNDTDGLAWGNPGAGFPPAVAQRGYTIVDPGNYVGGTQDFSAQIAAFRAGAAEVLLGVPSPADFATFWRQAGQQGYRPRLATIGRGIHFPATVEGIGAAAVNLATEVGWSPNHPFTSSLTGQSAADLATEYRDTSGRQWSQPIGFAHALFEVAAAAFGAVGSADDRRGIADAIAGMRLDTVVGPLDFTAGPVRGVAKTPLVGGQWRPGTTSPYELVVVSNARHPEIPAAGAVEALSAA
ncbi:ABC transporter substrate-binding protein [Pseudonocardia adelaidensis]|uniref:ABC transporter substrate-binding protein n=1 Tax=Pseudonocardia adelaidensis TaxID=648754 RepID=A0ABP9NFG1_9PSEU